MPDIVRHKSGAILFYLTPEEKKIEDTIKANKELQERLDKLEKLLVSQEAKTAESEPEAVVEPKTSAPKTRKKKTTE